MKWYKIQTTSQSSHNGKLAAALNIWNLKANDVKKDI